jgi:hypothetical protein
MTCAKCNKTAAALYGIPTGRFAHMPDPMAPKYCYECYVEGYGTDEEREALAEEKQIDQAIESDIEYQCHGI